ncbi:MAG TPA: PQQ-dependent sugar dehydrogenase, partial [Vicinamibacterales bacterium]|nr:PQQ-dependent sugar dehydrogenase [Vicinamibacterales bacterium]
MKRAYVVSVVAVAVAVASFTVLSAQQRGRGRPTAPPPINWPSPPLPDGPVQIDTGLVRPIRVSFVKGLVQPWSMAFLPDGGILVSERGGKLRMIRNGVLEPNPVEGLPNDIQAQGLGGLMDVQLHPNFAQNKLVYITYHKRQGPPPPPAPPAEAGRGRGRGPAGPPGVITLARGRWDGSKLVDVKDIFSAVAGGNASRILFARDGSIIMSVGSGDPTPEQYQEGDASLRMKMPAQDPMNLAGKTLRLKDDGTVPSDNPFVGRKGFRPEIYTLGHRNILGLALNPVTGDVWSVENGPNGGDEVNVLKPGKNYGWPVVNNGRFYLGPRVSEDPWKDGYEGPLVYWVPAIAPSGLTFYTGDKFPQWKNN